MDTGHEHLVVVGGGAAAVAVLRALVDEGAVRKVTVVEPRTLATGTAFASPHAWHLCNTSVGTMSIDPGDTGHLTSWLRRRGHTTGPDAFVPRSLYGHYLRDSLDGVLGSAERDGIEVVHVASTATAVDPGDGDHVLVVGADGRTVRADGAVVCSGTGPPRVPGALGRPTTGRHGLVPSPYTASFDDALAARARPEVLVLGTNLTAVDAAKSALRAGGRCTMASPSGELPAVRTALTLSSPFDLTAQELAAMSVSPRTLRQGLRSHVERIGREVGVPLADQVSRATTTGARLTEEAALARDGAAVWQYAVGHLLDLANDVWSHMPRGHMRALVRACGPWIKRYVSAIPLVSAEELLLGLNDARLDVRTTPVRLDQRAGRWRAEWADGHEDRFDLVVCAAGNEPPPWSVDGRGRLLHGRGASGRPLVSPHLEVVNAATTGRPRVWTVGPLSGDRFPVVNYMRTSVRQAATVAALTARGRAAVLSR